MALHHPFRSRPLIRNNPGLTNRSSQPLSTVKSTFDFMKQFSMFCDTRHRQRWLSSFSLDGKLTESVNIKKLVRLRIASVGLLGSSDGSCVLLYGLEHQYGFLEVGERKHPHLVRS